MSSSRPAVTPPAPDSFFSSTPPYPSPSPRSRRSRRDSANPGSRRHYFSDATDTSPPAAPARPSVPTVYLASSAAFQSTNPPRTSSLAATPNPPRTSSLLPPARIGVDRAASRAPPFLPDTFNDPRPAPKIPDPTREPESQSRHKRGHSRSSSAGGLSDTLRNLNRWSASTASSRASNLAGFTRRVSAELLGTAFSSPGRKLHKGKPSTSSSSPRSTAQPRTETESLAPAPIPPLQSLPRISTGPSLEDQVLESNVLAGLSPTEEPLHDDHPSGDNGALWDAEARALGQEPGFSLQQEGGPAGFDMIQLGSTMPYTKNGEARGPSQSRSAGAKTGADAVASTRNRDMDRDGDRERDRDRAARPPSQKKMLAKALEKANTAVRLDNAQNFEGARRAYAEACAVLQQVLLRTSGEEDRRKLEHIHETYLARVMDLDQQLADMEPEEKELPRRPESPDLPDLLSDQTAAQSYSGPFTSAAERNHEEDSALLPNHSPMQEPARKQPTAPRTAPSLSIDTSTDVRDSPSSSLTQQYSLQSAFSKSRNNNGLTLRPPLDNAYMPQPLSPRRPLSPARRSPLPAEPGSPKRPGRAEMPMPMPSPQPAPDTAVTSHGRADSHESISWLDPIDESERSSVTSVHSRSSSRIRRKHIRAPSGATEAEFDAALDDAIEAAYDDGYEPELQPLGDPYQNDPGIAMSNTLRRVELAREMARESEREVLELANEREKKLRLQQQLEDEEYRRQEAMDEDFYDGIDSEEEERLLEAMTKGKAIEDFAFGGPSRPLVPRESDSSGMTNRTWHSSTGSTAPTSTTILTPVSENSILAPPSGPFPALLTHLPPQPNSAGSQSSGQSVRNRRLSGQNPKQLKIETSKLAPTAPPATAAAAVPSQPRPGNYIVQQRQALSAGANRPLGPPSARSGPSPIPGGPGGEADEPLPSTSFAQDEHPRVGTPSIVRPSLRKNFSSSSLKSLKTRNHSISHVDEASDLSPGTPMTNQFGIGGSFTRLPAVPSLPPGVKDGAGGPATGGLHLFENHFHSPESAGLPNPLTPDAPAPLEPCPNEVMLRPFWLMRCLYQTLCHPRGGYLSNRLFVPRDVWRVKGVKLKNVEDKMANCDLLTAALQKLARVDTCDADLVLEEMQSLEGVLEQVQAALARKLGSDVGVQGTGALFKEAAAALLSAAAAAADGGDPAAMPRSASVAGKGSAFSWRRLRSKNSSANLPALPTAYGGKGGSGGSSSANGNDGTGGPAGAAAGKDALLLPSLPMTDHPTSRPAKRDVGSVMFAGPNANYMAALARLFDAAQTVDQIARQVDDPGLRHADKTQVGLELCTRHAAEFFAFYVCRFALADLALLLDKFIKRGTEWVLA